MTEHTAKQPSASHVFEFGDPEPVLTNNPLDYLGTYLDIHGEYYRPPVSLTGLANLMSANAHHGPILHFKKNMVLKWFIPSKLVTYASLQKAALDYGVFGNMYFQKFKNYFGKVVRTERLPAISMRRGKEPGQFFKLKNDGSTIEFKKDEVIHIKEPDIMQEIYGMPEYVGGIQSVLLSEEAGLFRRKYYSNGAHMGYILLTNDADLDDKTAQKIEEKVRASKGPGNFRSLYINIGKTSARKPVEIIPVGDISTKDEFERVKNITKEEMLSMHRMQAGLSGVMAENTGGYGDIKKIMEVYHELEIGAMQQPFLELNEHLGTKAVSFKDPIWQNDNSKDVMTINEQRVKNGLEPIEGGNAIYMPSGNIPAIEAEEG